MGVQKPTRSSLGRSKITRPPERELAPKAARRRAARASQGSGLSPSAHRDQRMAVTRMGLGPISKVTNRQRVSTKGVTGARKLVSPPVPHSVALKQKGKRKIRC